MILPELHARCLAFSPTDTALAVAATSGEAAIWSVPDGKHVRVLHKAGEPVNAIAFSRDGELVATGGADGAEEIWRTSTGEMLNHFNVLKSGIRTIEIDSHSKLVAAGGIAGIVIVSNVESGATVTSLMGPRNAVNSVHFDQQSQHIIGTSWDGTSRVWDVTPLYKHWSSPPIADGCNVLESVDPDRRFLPVTCRGHDTLVWDTANDRLLAVLPPVLPAGEGYNSAFAAVTVDGARAAIARGNTIELFSLPGATPLGTVTHTAVVTSVAFAAGGHDMVSGSTDGTVLVTQDGKTEALRLTASSAGIDVVGFLPDGRVVTADTSKRLRIYAPHTTTLLATLTPQSRAMLFRPSNDGRFLITLSDFKAATAPEVWDVENYRFVAQLAIHRGPVRSARFVRHDREILLADAEGAATLWESNTGRLLKVYAGSRFLADAILDPSEQMVIAGGGDGMLHFWDAETVRPLWTLPVHTPFVAGLHFEGNDIVTRGFRGDVARWSLPDPERVIAACSTHALAVSGHRACAMLP
jgi:WD40 repeat protein